MLCKSMDWFLYYRTSVLKELSPESFCLSQITPIFYLPFLSGIVEREHLAEMNQLIKRQSCHHM